MRIRKGVEDFLSAVTATVPRMEAVQFLRRYSRRGRAVTHYRTYGRGYDAVRKLLDRIGLVEGEDYTVKVSEYDKLTRQIHWNQTDRVHKLVEAAVSFDGKIDTLASLVASGATAEQITSNGVLNALPVGEECAPVAPDKVLGVNFAEVNYALHTGIREFYDEHDTDGLLFSDGFEQAVEMDLDYESVILPPDLLEIMLQVNRKKIERLRAKFPDLPKQLVFQHRPQSGRSVYRFLRQGEKVVGADMMLTATVADVMADSRPTNPLRGYLGTIAMQAPSSMEKKYAVFVRCDVPIHSAESLAWIAANYPRFFEYVAELYRTAYGDGLKVSFHKASRIGAPNNAMPHPRGRTGSVPAYIAGTFGSEGIQTDGSVVIAMLEFVITRDDHADLLETFSPADKPPVEIVHEIPPAAKATLYGRTNPDDADIPLEWFAATHGIGVSPIPVASGLRKREANLAALRESLDPSDADSVASAVLHCAFSSDNRGIFSNPDQEFNPVSAFYTGIIAAIRYRVQKPKKSEKPGRPGGTPGGTESVLHRDSGIITAVYSGVTTDQSGVMGDGTPEFPVFGSTIESAIAGSSYDFTAKARFTKAISELSESGVQLRMKERSKASVARKHWIIVETNVDGPEFMRTAPDLEHLRSDIANTFVRCMAMRVRDPRCSVDQPSRLRDFGPARGGSFIDAIGYDKYGVGDPPSWTPMIDLETAFGHSSPLNLSKIAPCDGSDGWYSKHGMDVKFALDTADRLYVVVTVEGDLAEWIMLAHRFDAGLPVRSARLLRKVAPGGRPVEPLDGGKIYVNRSYDRNPAAVGRVWQQIADSSDCSWDGEESISLLECPTFGPAVTRERLNVTGTYATRDRVLSGGEFS